MVKALERAIEIAGSQHALAALLGKRQGHVGNWLHRDKRVPADMCLPIERITEGRVTRYDLRPDIFGEAPANGIKRISKSSLPVTV